VVSRAWTFLLVLVIVAFIVAVAVGYREMTLPDGPWPESPAP